MSLSGIKRVVIWLNSLCHVLFLYCRTFSNHMLTYLDNENKRQRTLQQLNRGEGRHAVTRNVFHGKRGELIQAYR